MGGWECLGLEAPAGMAERGLIRVSSDDGAWIPAHLYTDSQEPRLGDQKTAYPQTTAIRRQQQEGEDQAGRYTIPRSETAETMRRT